MSLRNFRTVLLGDVAAKALTAAFVLGLVRYLSPAQFASYVYLSALMILSATLFSGFFNRHYILAASRGIDPRAYRALQVGTAAAIYGLVALLMGRDAAAADLLAGLVCAAAAASFDFSRTHAQKMQQFGPYSLSDVLRALLLALLALPAVLWGGAQTVALLLGAQALAFATAAQLLPRLPANAVADTPTVPAWRLLSNRASLALLGYFALVGLFGQLPVLLLKHYASAGELAAFGSAFRYYGLLLGVVAVVNVVILPRFAVATDVGHALRGVVGIVALASGLVAVAALVGYFAIPWIDTGKYPQAPGLFVLLCLGLLPGLALAPMTAAFLRLDRHAELLKSQVAAVMVCAATAWLLRSHGAWAAAWSVPAGVLAQLAWLGLMVALQRSRGGPT